MPEHPTNVGKWDGWYAGLELDDPQTYGSTDTYRIGASMLLDSGCKTVEDWGCGKGGFKPFWPHTYIGVDGSTTPFAAKTVDLVRYRSDVDGVFMRHVLEHDYNWRKILANAAASFRRCFVLVTFVPLGDEEAEVGFTPGLDVPDLSLPDHEIRSIISENARFPVEIERSSLFTQTQYELEDVFEVTRKT